MELSPFLVFVEDMLNELDEVIVMPYTLSGDLNWDMANLKIGEITTASSEDLPNAHVRSPAQSERKLYTDRTWDFTLFKPPVAAGDPLRLWEFMRAKSMVY